MKSKNTKIAALLAFIIGAMAIFAGGQVLLGKIQDYYVIDWLPIYNFAIGVISVFFTPVVLWKNCKHALPIAIITFGLHAAVMVILQTAYREVVAPDSIVAMTVRLTVWSIILVLLFVDKRKIQE